jgi:hypothetical protein
LQFEGPVDTIDDHIAEDLVPTLREALSNVAHHARAHNARLWGVPLRATSVVEQWAPPHLMAMVSERPPRPLRVRAIHQFDPTGPEVCRYRWEIDLTPIGPLGHLASRALASSLQRNTTAQNRRFKSEVERRWRDRSDQQPRR